MDCREIKDNLSAYMDHELAPAAGESIRQHLGVCDQCAANYAKLLKGWQVLDAWEDSAPPDGMRRNILQSAKPRRNAVSVRAIMSLAAALILVVGLAVYYTGLKGRSIQELARKQSPIQAVTAGDISEDEIIANLLILQEGDFFEELDELVKIDDLPFAEEPSRSIKEPERSSLELSLT
ncbi:MAG: zf-HC2 domain-containing protein [Nitrospirae bacterium]|nr:zf-HC2 domain-containing protein [Nitrospirota bacterium]